MTVLATTLAIERHSALERQARELIQAAKAWGLVVTIGLEPLKPLAMGRHRPVIGIRPVR